MSIAIKVPPLPYSAPEAIVGHGYIAVGDRVARGEVLVELLVRDEVIPISTPQAGTVERIFFQQGSSIDVGAVLFLLKTDLPNLVWDADEDTLILELYRARATSSQGYELRQLLREGVGKKYAKGFGPLALPEFQADHPEAGMGHGQAMDRQFKNHPAFAHSQQMSGDFKNPRVRSIPSEARQAPDNAPALTLAASPKLGPTAPTPTPKPQA